MDEDMLDGHELSVGNSGESVVGGQDEGARIATANVEEAQFEEIKEHAERSIESEVADRRCARGPGMLYGNFYKHAQTHRQKVIGFLQKDLAQIEKPDLRRFLNINHAYECLLPYHLFGSHLYEDMMFMHTNEIKDNEEIDAVLQLLKETVEDVKSCDTNESLVCELLLYYQQRYINSMYAESREHKNARRSRHQLNRRNTVFRLRIGADELKRDVTIREGRLYFKKGE
ncbi:hypothetical protein OCOL_001723 [Ordospora colligata]|uniref:GLTSCR protein conserved domain-containing protein n=1 Tax=Ordospora colligata OC4 TaxID=1354746 RepID=A0A0B2UIV8_9MICR|nr:uncharacterized protein M896_090970 [Ordospora colligata OC4]KHN69169.1 hypothetical protein M896_090970 [Ordospora colligata OC4]TBU14624.1 hypothetical protein CWI41_090960 [Ordospora colligata]